MIKIIKKILFYKFPEHPLVTEMEAYTEAFKKGAVSNEHTKHLQTTIWRYVLVILAPLALGIIWMCIQARSLLPIAVLIGFLTIVFTPPAIIIIVYRRLSRGGSKRPLVEAIVKILVIVAIGIAIALISYLIY
jgi:hypothetical protein